VSDAAPQSCWDNGADDLAEQDADATDRVVAHVDLASIGANVRRLDELTGDAAMMVVVKADGYGHGLVELAQAARTAGASWLGVAVLEEALALRASGDAGRLLCWLAVPGEPFDAAVAADVDVTASSVRQLAEVVAAARRVGRRARLQLKVDTGLSRNGAPPTEWDAVLAAAVQARDLVEVTGIWSHLACSDEPSTPPTTRRTRVPRSGRGCQGAWPTRCCTWRTQRPR
jgi:alanine racemase